MSSQQAKYLLATKNQSGIATESIVAIQIDLSPRRRDFRNYGQGFRILVCLVLGPKSKLMSPTASSRHPVN
jgi:hypothetical protein